MFQVLSQWYLGICVPARKSLKSYRACVELEVLVVIVQAVRYVKFIKSISQGLSLRYLGIWVQHIRSEILEGCVPRFGCELFRVCVQIVRSLKS